MFNPVDPHPNFPKLEEEILKFWEDNKIFERSLEKNSPSPSLEKRGVPSLLQREGKGEFTFYDGPPFATGLPHYGHILASTIKDVIPRYQTMRGRFVRRRWGWDCHGLPIEEIVEKKLKISGKKDVEEKIGIKKFNETCRSMVLQYVTEWGKMVKRIARWVDFHNSYKTMDRDYMESVWWAFKDIYKKGLVYEGRKVLLYCPRCETPISNFEVAMDNSYQTITEESVIVKFRVTAPSVILNGVKDLDSSPPSADQNDKRDVYFLSWTTTPWTLPGNVALAVGKDIEYVVVRSTPTSSPPQEGGEREGVEYYIIAKDRARVVIPDLIRNPEILNRVQDDKKGLDSRSPIAAWDKFRGNDIVIKGSDLVGLEYEPLFDVPALRTPPNPPLTKGGSGGGVYKVHAADFVTTEEGTGIVHTAVVYGEDDYELGQKVGLPVVPLLDEKGVFNDKAPALIRGKYFKDAEKIIKDDLEKQGLLFKRESHTHSYPHCWRCDTALFYNAIPSWFIKISKIKSQILKSNKEEINWYPEHLKFGRYAKSVEQAPDWNISRNRYWGNPIPVWRCQKCGKDTVVGSIKELLEKSTPSSSPPYQGGESAGVDLHRPYIDEVLLKCEHCGGSARRITEIFDSWFEAASMPFASVHYPFTHPSPLSPPTGGEGKGGGKAGVGGEFQFPAQFVAEYIAQTRAWFYVMHVMSLILFERAPFENVVTTGTILNEKGDKLSKSRKNFPDPWEIINKYGVDSLRFYLMNSVVMQADNLFFSERDLQTVYRKVTLILWNVYNYFVTYAKAAGLKPLSQPLPSQGERGVSLSLRRGGKKGGVEILDEWILCRLQELTNQVTGYLDNYDTVRATREIESFVSDLSTWYLRRSRGREDKAFFDTLRYCLVELSKVVAPFMPYAAEQIYRDLTPTLSLSRRGKSEVKSVHLTDWPEAKKLTAKQTKLLQEMAEVRKIVEEVHALRAKAGIKLRQPLARLVIPASEQGSSLDSPIKSGNDNFFTELINILKDEVNVLDIKFGDKLELNTKITPELKIAGLARELMRQIQQFRKESGLKIGEIVDLYYETKSDMLKKAIKLVDRKKIYVKSPPLPLPLSKGEKEGVGEGRAEKEIEVEGETVLIALNQNTKIPKNQKTTSKSF